MSRLPLTAALVVLLLFGGATIFFTLAGTPAFNDKLQEEGLFGERTVGSAHVRYNASDYLKLMGRIYILSDLLPPGIPLADGVSGPAPLDVALARGVRGTGFLVRSVSLAPADADSWYQLAQGLFMAGNAEDARIALAQSWALAPYHRQLGARRLRLVRVLFSDGMGDRPVPTPRWPTEPELVAVARDLDTLRQLSPGEYQQHVRRLPANLQ